jgi:hypothetical protein
MKKLLTEDNIENVIAWSTGDILATVVAFNLLTDVAKPVLIASLTGFIGGAFAILGKIFVKRMFKKFE